MWEWHEKQRMDPARKIRLIVGGVLALAGFLMMACAAIGYLSPDAPEEFTASTQATITKIESYRSLRDGEWETEHDVTVIYAVEGRQYEAPLDHYASSMREGDVVTVYYDTRHPGVPFTPGVRKLAMAVIGAVGLFFFVIGVIILRMRTHAPEPAMMDETERERFDEELDLLERLANGEIEIVEKTPENEKSVEGESI